MEKEKCKILVQGVLQRLTDAYGVLNLSVGTRQALLRVGMPEDREMPKISVRFLSSFLKGQSCQLISPCFLQMLKQFFPMCGFSYPTKT